MNGYCGTNDSANSAAGTTGVGATNLSACDKAAVKNIYPDITGSCRAPSGGCQQGYRWSGDQCACIWYNCNQSCNGGGPNSPILVDVKGEGFPLTSASNGVWFDMNGDGNLQKISWTAENSHVGFLVLDRNNDGIINNGTELFGNFTPQAPSAHPNGFLALGEFDKPENGGNGDGVIDASDTVFQKLRIWIDSNHDGYSEPWELHPLSELGITAFSLNYHFSYRRDQSGNQFRYRARVSGSPELAPFAWDVFFVSALDSNQSWLREPGLLQGF